MQGFPWVSLTRERNATSPMLSQHSPTCTATQKPAAYRYLHPEFSSSCWERLDQGQILQKHLLLPDKEKRLGLEPLSPLFAWGTRRTHLWEAKLVTLWFSSSSHSFCTGWNQDPSGMPLAGSDETDLLISLEQSQMHLAPTKPSKLLPEISNSSKSCQSSQSLPIIKRWSGPDSWITHSHTSLGIHLEWRSLRKRIETII